MKNYNMNYKKLKRFMILHPEDPIKQAWNMYILALLIFLAYWIPYSLSFLEQESITSIDYVINISLLMDIILNFNTSFFSKGVLIRKRRIIALKYLRGMFWFDMLSSFPYEWLTQTSNKSGLLKYLKIFRFFRIIKLLRLTRVKDILLMIETYIMNEFVSVTFEILKIGLFLSIFAHWIACTFYFISYIQIDSSEMSWIKAAELNREGEISIAELYVTALYWAFTTMITVGYGDIVPLNIYEMLVTITCMALSCAYFAYIIGNMGAIVSRHLSFETKKTEIRTQINKYLKKNNIPRESQIKIKAFIDNQMDNISNYIITENEVLTLLSQPLRDEILYLLYHDILNNSAVFKKHYTEDNVASLTKALKVENFSPNDIIFYEKQQSRKAYFICSGSVSMTFGYTNLEYKMLKKGNMFGEIGFFVGHSRTASVKCLDFTLVQSLDYKDLSGNISNKDNFDQTSDFLVDACKFNNYASLLICCYLCDCLGHVARDCKTEKIKNAYDEISRKYSKRKTKVVKDLNKQATKHINYPRFYKKKHYPETIFKEYEIIQGKIQDFLKVENELTPEIQKMNVINEMLNESEDD